MSDPTHRRPMTAAVELVPDRRAVPLPDARGDMT